MNFLFYDLETSGLSAGAHRPMQFAAILTDENLNEVKRVNWLIRLGREILPDPVAIFTTGIAPQKTELEGMDEPEFLKKLEDLLLPKTVILGFNSIAFDDEFMRYTFWRNFIDPYEWQWKDGKSRADVLGLARMARALRPENIEWPIGRDGKPTNNLVDLARLNGIEHSSAHDALSDVEATLGLAKMVKDNQPKLFEFFLKLSNKKFVESYLDLESPKPVVHVTPKFPAEHLQTSIVFPLCPTPGRAGGVLVYDLRYDPDEFLKLNAQQLKHLLFSKRSYLSNLDEVRLPIKQVQFNKCPILAPLEVLDADAQRRIGLGKKTALDNLEKLKKNLTAFSQKVYEAYKSDDKKWPAKTDPDMRLYDGFVGSGDRNLMSAIASANPADLKEDTFNFSDERLKDLFLLYKARNYPEELTSNEQLKWSEYLAKKSVEGAGGKNGMLPRDSYLEEITRLKKSEVSKEKMDLLEQLEEWANA